MLWTCSQVRRMRGPNLISRPLRKTEQRREMPLKDADNRHSKPGYVSAKKVYIDSTDTEALALGKYRAQLREIHDNIIGVSLVGYNLPAAPSFVPDTGNVTGNDTVDFELWAGLNPAVPFTAYFPARGLQYSSATDSDSYIFVLATILNEAIAADTDFGDGKVVFEVVENSVDMLTRIELTTVHAGLLATPVNFALLFSDGANSRSSAYEQMGFAQSTYTSAATDVVTVHFVESPVAANLALFRYVDVEISQFSELAPLARVFLDQVDRTVENAAETHGVRFLENGPKRLAFVDVTLTVSGNRRVDLAAHDLALVLYCQSASHEMPKYADRQTFPIM